METLQNTDLKNIINDSLQKAINYQDYRNLVKDLVAKESTTGTEKTEALANYTMLNDRRMKRWDKTVKVPEALQEQVSALKVNQTWLVLTESWCGDAAHVMPVINKVAELNKGIDFKVVLRDENEALMSQFLTNGGQAIPKLIMIDNITNKVVNTFGPRPTEATKLVNAYKAEHGMLTPEFKEDLQGWYNKNKGQNAIDDLVGLMR
ncbi:thioredoxin family protein [Lacinutrix sp. Bg11-31]|uniref:thioredoxin family protein n=1 Tax=Lacinutrix sp. Bg11-31 TaxID=2057808 RepID=UPI000C31233C|nr:thioredoxin family protein [Lacinutrix sp. Bg11-31]AUC83192.1 thioredoxin family protein [Lacinutrix sp. Bg11-31]